MERGAGLYDMQDVLGLSDGEALVSPTQIQ
jgi:hypothetical protein